MLQENCAILGKIGQGQGNQLLKDGNHCAEYGEYSLFDIQEIVCVSLVKYKHTHLVNMVYAFSHTSAPPCTHR